MTMNMETINPDKMKHLINGWFIFEPLRKLFQKIFCGVNQLADNAGWGPTSMIGNCDC